MDGDVPLASPRHCPTSAVRERVLSSHPTPALLRQLRSLDLHRSLLRSGTVKQREPGAWSRWPRGVRDLLGDRGDPRGKEMRFRNQYCEKKKKKTNALHQPGECLCREMSVNHWAEQRAPRVSRARAVPYAGHMRRQHAERESLGDAQPEPARLTRLLRFWWGCFQLQIPGSFPMNVFQCLSKICPFSKFASEHLRCDILGMWT